ncbi:regulatory protein [Oceanicola granulosus HTCC2516]|uniref:Regulatory protein n=1 Tax=Oceanicola granulosus (strain ATCC BAA-861 / DSM 15982 / KCTC 12143 / HTCC2516) TaxID=314256 RepID=Q2CBW0_OCEGH|nr:helix-turn-helix domain-containing protein [Oceanicola granulosus]EAR50160.1 regulatory protein [Oceanicola granulosus HTCC2516]
MSGKRTWDLTGSPISTTPGLLHASRCEPGIMPAPHWHAQIEINYVERGALQYQMADHALSLPAGEIALFWGGLPHRLTDTGADTIYHVIHLPLPHFFRLRLPPGVQRGLMTGAVLAAAGAPAEEEALFGRIRAYLASGNSRRAAHAIDELLLRLERIALEPHRLCGGRLGAAARGAEPGGHPALLRLFEAVAAVFRDEVRAADIAEAAGLHPKYAMSLFKRATGMSLADYVTLLRLSFAQSRLVADEASVLEIALDAGFGSVSAFNKAFRRQTGTTPTAYRKSLVAGPRELAAP